MSATSLPLELLLQIFRCLDARSFVSARSVSRSWRSASIDTVTLRRLLGGLPVIPQAKLTQLSLQELQSLFHEASTTLMLGLRPQHNENCAAKHNFADKLASLAGPKVLSSSRTHKAVTVSGRTFAHFETSTWPPSLLAQRCLDDKVGTGLWLKAESSFGCELALSSNGYLLALATRYTVQLYNLSASPASLIASTNVVADGPHICAIEFDRNDYMLRVHLSGNGGVMYLGTPAPIERGVGCADSDHWRSDAGLKHVFLHSLLLSATQPMSPFSTARYSGLQLLGPLYDGFVFAGQKHHAGNSSHYILGHVKLQKSARDSQIAADSGSVTELLRLETFLSSQDYALDSVFERGTSGWSDMPSAHQHQPRFALSPDCKFMVLAERDKKYVGATVVNQFFLYRLPNQSRLKDMLQRKQQQGNRNWPTVTGFLDGLESQARPSDGLSAATTTSKYDFARMPICLGSLSGSICDMSVTKNEKSYEAIVETDETVRSWVLNQSNALSS